MRKIVALCILSIAFTHAPSYAQTPAQDYRKLALARQEVVTTLPAFIKALRTRIGKRPFAVYEYLGFSGAGYSDVDRYKRNFKQRVLAAQQETKKKWGPNAITVFLLGGTTDGFGAGYEVLQQLRDSGRLPGVIIAGLVSDAAVKYHLQGAQEGWGDVISPQQDLLLLMDVYKKPGQEEAWELLSKKGGMSATVQVLRDLAQFGNAKQVTMALFEGGQQAIKEAAEYLYALQNNRKARLVLHVGYEPKKIDKAKGFRGASNIAWLLKDTDKQRGIALFFTFKGDPRLHPASFYYQHAAGNVALNRETAQEK